MSEPKGKREKRVKSKQKSSMLVAKKKPKGYNPLPTSGSLGSYALINSDWSTPDNTERTNQTPLYPHLEVQQTASSYSLVSVESLPSCYGSTSIPASGYSSVYPSTLESLPPTSAFAAQSSGYALVSTGTLVPPGSPSTISSLSQSDEEKISPKGGYEQLTTIILEASESFSYTVSSSSSSESGCDSFLPSEAYDYFLFSLPLASCLFPLSSFLLPVQRQ
jgi:hypothetical protein